MMRIVKPQALEILRFAAQGKAWPTGEPSATYFDNTESGVRSVVDKTQQSRIPIEASIIRQALLGNPVDSVQANVFLDTEIHHEEDWDSLERGLYRNSTIVIMGVEVVGALNMLAAVVNVPVYFVDCSFPQGVSFQDATCTILGFIDCDVSDINLHRIHVKKTILLDYSRFPKGVELGSSRIENTLSCIGAQLGGDQSRKALNANGAYIGDGVFLRTHKTHKFKAFGVVDFIGATIKSSFECDGGDFVAGPNGVAIDGNGAKIDGCVFLRDDGAESFSAKGKVAFIGANIGETVDCSGGKFEALNSDRALDFSGAKIKGGVFLRETENHRFHAIGGVDFLSSLIGQSLDCGGGKFEAAKDGSALDCDGASIGASVFLNVGEKKAFTATGEVGFAHTTIVGQMSCVGASFDAGPAKAGRYGDAFDLRHATIGRDFLWYNLSSFRGQLDLSNATVGALVDAKDCWPVEGLLGQRKNSKFEGDFVLDGFRYDRLDGESPTDARHRLEWLGCQPTSHLKQDFRPHAWTQLVKILKENGHEGDARTIAIDREEKRTRMYRQKWMRGQLTYITHWAGGVLFGFLVRFGYRPVQGVIISLAIIIAFGAFFAFEEGQNRLVPAHDETLIYMESNDKTELPQGYAMFNPWIYSADLFIPLIDLQQASNWQPVSTQQQSGPRPQASEIVEQPELAKSYLAAPTVARSLMWLEITLGWVLTALTGLAFTGILRRE